MAAVALGLLCARSASARHVTVRLYKGDEWNASKPMMSQSFESNTRSAYEDREFMWDLRDPKTQASIIIGVERGVGYGVEKLVNEKSGTDLKKTGLEKHVNGNWPTKICYCSGHVLLMAAKTRLKRKTGASAPYVPPLAAGGDALYGMAKDWGNFRGKYEGILDKTPPTEPGDLVFYINKALKMRDRIGRNMIYSPAHVVIVSRLGGETVITKDGEGQVYEMNMYEVQKCLNHENRKKHVSRIEVWGMPWDELTVQVVTGPCEVTEVKRIPEDVRAGNMAKVSFKFKVPNAPGKDTKMLVQVKIELLDPQGNVPHELPLTRVDADRKGPAKQEYLEGEISFERRIRHPGPYSWKFEVRATQLSDDDEGIVIYEPGFAVIPFTVR